MRNHPTTTNSNHAKSRAVASRAKKVTSNGVLNAARLQVSEIGDSISDAGTRMNRAVRRGGRRVVRSVQAQQENASAMIKARPFSSVLAGIGIGMAFGLLPLLFMRRARSSFCGF